MIQRVAQGDGSPVVFLYRSIRRLLSSESILLRLKPRAETSRISLRAAILGGKQAAKGAHDQ